VRRPRRPPEEEEKRTKEDSIEIPYDPVGEQVIIAAALVDQDSRRYLTGRHKADQFSVPEHVLAWTHIVLPMQKGSLEYDPALVQQLSAGKVEVQYLFDLVEARPEPPANLEFHSEQLSWDAARMTAVRGPLASLLAGLRDPHTRPERVKAITKSLALTFETHEGRSYLRNGKQLVLSQSEQIAERMRGRAVFPYGVPAIDTYEEGHRDYGKPRLVPGAKPGFVTVITGVSGHGKSTLAARIALGLARQRRRILYGAWEMEDGMTLELIAGMSLGYSRTALMTGTITQDEHACITRRMEQIEPWITFMQNPFMVERAKSGKRTTYEHNLDIIEKHIADSGCDVFIADLWARCLVTDDPGEEAMALHAQQDMLQRMQVHGVLCQQQNLDKLEQRRDKWPTQGTVFGSKAWTHIADTMLGVNLPHMWRDVPNNVAEVHVLKQRWAPFPLLVEVEWDPDRGGYGAGTSVPYPRSSGGSEGSLFEAPRRGGGKHAH
jgi:DnaB-like helicase C terminal domain